MAEKFVQRILKGAGAELSPTDSKEDYPKTRLEEISAELFPRLRALYDPYEVLLSDERYSEEQRAAFHESFMTLSDAYTLAISGSIVPADKRKSADVIRDEALQKRYFEIETLSEDLEQHFRKVLEILDIQDSQREDVSLLRMTHPNLITYWQELAKLSLTMSAFITLYEKTYPKDGGS